jgi:Arm domain-containing DNA-binding protein/integrase-like protein
VARPKRFELLTPQIRSQMVADVVVIAWHLTTFFLLPLAPLDIKQHRSYSLRWLLTGCQSLGNPVPKNCRTYSMGMETKITKRAVDQLPVTKCDGILWDTEVKGFGVRCRRSGAKYYILKTRVGGRQRWLTIGRHGSPWAPDKARVEALRLLGLKAAGHDPALARDRQKGAITIAELAMRFLSEYVAQHCKPRTAEEYQRAVKLYINPIIGRQRIADLTRADVTRLHHCFRDRPYQANRALAVLSKMMNLALTDHPQLTRHVFFVILISSAASRYASF